MPNNELPNLSAWHRVPIGATIPAGVPYAYTYDGGVVIELDGYHEDTVARADGINRYTEHPIALPLPTEDGATILASARGDRMPWLALQRFGTGWRYLNGSVSWLEDSTFTAWAPVTIGETVVIR